MNTAIKKLLDFLDHHPDCGRFLEVAQQTYFGEFAAAHGLPHLESVRSAIGDPAMGQIYPCLLEFFFTNDYAKRGKRWNMIDVFLRKKGAQLDAEEEQYIRDLHQSHMSIYEVLEVEPEQGFVLRDMVEGGTVCVREKAMTRDIVQRDVLGLRVCGEVLSGGGLPLHRETGAALARELAALHKAGMLMVRSGGLDGDYSPAEAEHLLKVMWAPEIGTAYMEDCFAVEQEC